MDKILSGGYKIHSEVGEQEMMIFRKAMEKHLGVHYKPVAVASQIVNGINYIFVCVGAPVVPNPIYSLYAVKIYTKFSPHEEGPVVEITSIEEIDVKDLN